MKRFFRILSQKKIKYLLHNNIVQQMKYFWHKYSFQRVLNQIQGPRGYEKHPLQCKMEIPFVRVGEGGLK